MRNFLTCDIFGLWPFSKFLDPPQLLGPKISIRVKICSAIPRDYRFD